VTSVGLSTTPAIDAIAPTTPRAQHILAASSVGVLLTVDALAVMGSFLAAYMIRFALADPIVLALTLTQYIKTATVVGVLAALLMAVQGLADLDRRRSWPTRLRAITSAVSTGLVLAVVFSFDQDQRLSRAWLAIGWTLAIVSLSTWRSIATTLHLAVRRQFTSRPRLVIVGANILGQELARDLESRFEVIGYVDNGTDIVEPLDRPLLGPIADLESVVRSGAIDEIVIVLPADRREQVDRVIARGFGRQVDVKVLADLGEQLPRRLEVGRFGARPYIGFAPVAPVTWLKRAFDLVVASITVVIGAPLLLCIAIAIKLDSPGPVLYRQRRVGKDGVAFEMLKFRSMCADAEDQLARLSERNEASGPLFKIRRDPRVTRVGRILRRGSLDELPQIFIVLRREMSLVGPRPPLPSEVARYEDWQLARLRALPGMTGLWQVSGRSEVPFNDMVRLDLHYVRNWSLGLDLEIILRTIPAVIANRGAY